MRIRALLLSSFLGACYATSGSVREPVLETQIAYDDNRPTEDISFITTTFESMVRFAPTVSYRPLRLRAMLARPGRLRWTIYEQDTLEQPGTVLATWERDYSAAMTSGPSDGRWVVEDLQSRLPGSRSGAIWVGIRRIGGAPHLWASGITTNHAFIRDTDPERYLKPMPVRQTPMIRFDFTGD